MRICVKWIITVLLCGALFFTGMLGASAAELISSEEHADIPISTGLCNIAKKTDMVVSAKQGELYYFEYADFCRAMNLSDLSYITVTKSPDASLGTAA